MEDESQDHPENLLESGKDNDSSAIMEARKKHQLDRDRIQKVKNWLKNSDNILVSLTVIAVVLGLVVGLLLKVYQSPSQRTIYLLSFPGEVLMNMLKMLIIPLIVSSLIAGLASLDAKSSGKIGLYALIYYVITTAMAVALGIGLVLSIHPGNANIKQTMGEGAVIEKRLETLDSMLDLIRNLFPENIAQACLQQQQSTYTLVNKTRVYIESVNSSEGLSNTSNDDPISSYETYEVVRPKYVDGTNVLGLVSFSILFGLVLGQMGDKAIVMVQFFSILNEVIMRMVQIIMFYSPFGIFFLILGKMLEIRDLRQTAASLGLYMTTVITGLAVHSLGSLALLYFIFTRKNPYKFYKGIFQAWITALGTASSAATLPITFRCLECNLNVDKRVTRFVLPIGATINMDGTALYEAVASIFIAQINAKHLTFIEVLIVSITATLAAIGAASVPSAGLVTMMLVLTSVGLPTKDISLILAVDWLLDRIRTSINVMGDAVGAGIVDALCRKELAKMDAETERELGEMVVELTRRVSQSTSPTNIEKGRAASIKSQRNRKRMSVAAAVRLQDSSSPFTAIMPQSPVGIEQHFSLREDLHEDNSKDLDI